MMYFPMFIATLTTYPLIGAFTSRSGWMPSRSSVSGFTPKSESCAAVTGAEFEVYRDTNGNKELDEGDELLGKLEETSTGIYEMSHILYGGVFVREQ